MNATDYQWSLGTLIGLPLLVLTVLVLVPLGIWLIRFNRRVDEFDKGIPLVVGIAALGAALLLTVGTAVGMWPYDAEYHQWRATTGVVQTIDSRLLAQDHGSTQRFVVTFTDGRLRSCDDTRCAEVHKGDHLTLACKRAWQWSGTHGYDCNFVSDEATR